MHIEGILVSILIFSGLIVATSHAEWSDMPEYIHQVSEKAEPMQTGKFEPTWESLRQYKTPDWFQDAKFGIWAHWGPQCQPEEGDWYARHMYVEGHRQYNAHLSQYGHPSVFGFKDVINEWKAEKWNPDKLVELYKKTGAQYFVAMANHHDNFDYFDSTYQPWNSVSVGPRQNIIGGWAAAAKKYDLPFGVSVHAAHAWSWYETSQGADTKGPLAGVPYDGKLTKADGKGTWWEGLDPQDLYAQNHELSPNRNVHEIWHWDVDRGVTVPDAAYCEKFYNRTLDLLNKYKPDLIYFDDTILPLYPISDAGPKIAAHFYNSSMKWNDGKLRAVMNNKILSEEQRQCMVWDIEKGHSNRIESYPWQTCSCIGSWHYDRSIYDRRGYKSAKTVIHMLADIVSKNGNLLLSVPLRGDGTFDSEEGKTLKGIGDWMSVNREGIVATRPWKIFGEGPALEDVTPISAQGFNEGRGKEKTWEDVRYTVSKDGKTLYAITMGRPVADGLTLQAALFQAGDNAEITLLSFSEPIDYHLGEQGQLTMTWSQSAEPRDIDEIACVFKISGFEFDVSPAYAPNAIVLKAEEALLDGTQIRCEEKNGRVNIGYWNDSAEGVHWLLTVPEAGAYRFSGEFSAMEPSQLQIQIDGKQVAFEVPRIGDWANGVFVEIGSVRFDNPGIYHVQLYPQKDHGYHPVNVWKIQCSQ